MAGTISATGASSMVEAAALMDAIPTPTREIIRTWVEEFSTQNGKDLIFRTPNRLQFTIYKLQVTSYNPMFLFFFFSPIIATEKATFVVKTGGG